MAINAYNLSSGCNETIEHDKKTGSYKKCYCFSDHKHQRIQRENINKRDTYLSKIKIFLSNNHDASN
jgi:hypothetical protein